MRFQTSNLNFHPRLTPKKTISITWSIFWPSIKSWMLWFVRCFFFFEKAFFFFFFLFQYNFIEHTHVQLTFTKDNLQQNENYNLKLTKKKPNTIKTLVVTKIKWELSKQNFIPYLKETKKQTILIWNLFRDQSYKKYTFLD